MPERRVLQGLVDRQVENAIQELTKRLSRAGLACPMALRYPVEDPTPVTAYWNERDKFWAVVDNDASGMCYCSYGLGDPRLAPQQSYLFQINVRWQGNAWAPAGAFATDGRHTYYLHKGRVGNTTDFAQRYRGERVDVKWPGIAETNSYFVVGRLDDPGFVRQLGAYVTAVARFREGGSLEAEYRSTFEQGLEEAIADLQSRIGGADQSGSHAAGAEVEDAKRKLERLEQVQQWLRFDKYLLQEPVERITREVYADRRRRAIVSVAAAGVSIVIGWLLSAISPQVVFTVFARH